MYPARMLTRTAWGHGAKALTAVIAFGALLLTPAIASAKWTDDAGVTPASALLTTALDHAHKGAPTMALFWPQPNRRVGREQTTYGLVPSGEQVLSPSGKGVEGKTECSQEKEQMLIQYAPVKETSKTRLESIVEGWPSLCPSLLGGTLWVEKGTKTLTLTRSKGRKGHVHSHHYKVKAKVYENTEYFPPECGMAMRLHGTQILVTAALSHSEEHGPIAPACSAAKQLASRVHELKHTRGK